MNTRQKGSRGEESAVEYLLQNGYSIITRNYQARNGEIDCVAQDPNGTLVFVEVKSGYSSGPGHPLFRVTKAKQATLKKMAMLYLYEHAITNKPCRFDVIALVNGKIEHLKNAFLV